MRNVVEIKYKSPVDHLTRLNAQDLALKDPKEYKDKLVRPTTMELIDHVYRLTTSLKRDQLKAHFDGNEVEYKQYTQNLKALKPHVKAINEAHEIATGLRLNYRKKSEDQVKMENEEQKRKIQEMFEHIKKHPRKEKTLSLSNSFKKITSPVTKGLKGSLSLPSSLKGKFKEKSPNSSTHSAGNYAGTSSTTEGSD